MMEPGAAPALTPRKRDPGRPRAAVRFHYGRPPSVAGRERRKGGESRLDQGCDHFPSAAGRTAPGTEIAASSSNGLKLFGWSAGEACVLHQHALRFSKSAEFLMRLPGAPLPSCEGKEKRGRRKPNAAN